MTIHPDFNEHFNLPTIYDDIKIGDKEVTIQNDDTKVKSFTIILKPNGQDADNIRRAEDLQAMLQKAYNETLMIIINSTEQKQDDKSLKKIQLEIKSVIENYKSLLDYTAHFIAQKCNPIPTERKVYFPIASKSVSELDFTRKFEKDFPDLKFNCKEVYDYILYIQHFNNDLFLCELNELVNQFKHRGLTELEMKKYKPIELTCGDVGVRIGELGFNSIEIEKDGKLILDNKKNKAIINGPCKLTELNYKDFSNIDNISVQEVEFNLLTPKGSTKSITGLLWAFSMNIIRVINNICIQLK